MKSGAAIILLALASVFIAPREGFVSSHVSHSLSGTWCAVTASDVYPRTSDGSDTRRASWWRSAVPPAMQLLVEQMDAELAARMKKSANAGLFMKRDPKTIENTPLCQPNISTPQVWPCILSLAGRKSAELASLLSEEQKDSMVLNHQTGEIDKLGPFGRIRLQILISSPLPPELATEVAERFAVFAAQAGQRAKAAVLSRDL